MARDAEVAMNHRDAAEAQQRYREAIALYTRSQAESAQIAALARAESDARAAASGSDAARRAAEFVNAPKAAQSAWATAEATDRQAQNALKQRAFDRAHSLYGDAERAYRAAAKAATDNAAAEAKKLETAALVDAERARQAMIQAREEAEKFSASNLASRTFAQAKQKEGDGVVLLDRRDSAAARARFQEAQQGYRQAAVEAEGIAAASRRQQSDAEKVRGSVADARRSAEQAGAPRYSAKPFAAAQSKEREGVSALGRSDFEGATRAFGEAKAGYDTAAKEAKLEADQEQRVAALRRNVELSHSLMVDKRTEALKGEADRLAKDRFDAARAREAEGNALAGRQELAEATKAYQDAAERYRDASTRAQMAREAFAREAKAQADTAKTRMIAEKQQASKDASEFSSGLEEEKTANALYDKQSYQEAAAKFKSAETLFAKAKAAPPPPPAPPPPQQKPEPAKPAPTPAKPPSRPLPPSF
jgi:hypothetical protein